MDGWIDHYNVRNSPPLVPIQCQMHPIHIFPLCFHKVHSDIWEVLAASIFRVKMDTARSSESSYHLTTWRYNPVVRRMKHRRTDAPSSVTSTERIHIHFHYGTFFSSSVRNGVLTYLRSLRGPCFQILTESWGMCVRARVCVLAFPASWPFRHLYFTGFQWRCFFFKLFSLV